MILKTKLRLWWRKLWLRRDEFNKSLELDAEVLSEMDEIEGKNYVADLSWRRNIAHLRDLEKS